jgi:hypothetical protein
MHRFALGLGVLCTLAFTCSSALAQTPIYDCYNGSSEQGGNRLTVNGIQTSQYAQQSYPAATVTIYNHSTLTLATGMTKDDAGVQPLANPFVSTAHGVAFICGPDGRYDLQYSGTGISVPFTVSDVHLCFACSGGGGGGGVNLTPYQVARADSTGHTLQDSTGSDNPSNGPTRWSQGLSVEGNAGYRFFVNSTAGTTLNLLVCRDTGVVTMTQVTTCPVSSNSVFGLADNGAGVTGNVRVAMIGFHPCVFDNQTVIGDWAVPSTATAGECSDAGATKPTTQQVLGHVTTLNTGADTLATVDLWTGDTISGGGATVAIGPCAGTNCNAYYPTSNSIAGDVSVTDDGVGNMTMKSAGMTDTTQSGFWYQHAGPALPTLSGLNNFYFATNPSFGTTYGIEPFDSAPTATHCVDLVAGDAAGWLKLHDAGAACGTGSGTEVQVNSVDTSTQSPISFNDSSTVAFTNPSAGIIQASTILTQLSSPTAPTITQGGAAGAVAYSYKIVGCEDGNTCAYHSAATSAGSTATGNATLTTSNFNKLTLYADTLYGYRCYNVYRTASAGTPGSTGLIATCVDKQWNDTGATGDGSTAPSTNTTQTTVTMSPTAGGCNYPPGSPSGGVDALPCTVAALSTEFTDTSGIADTADPIWTWVNQNSATATLTGGMLSLAAPSRAGSENLNCLVITAPVTPYSFVGLIYPSMTEASASTGIGLFMVGFRESATSKLELIGLNYQNVFPASRIAVAKYTNTTTSSSFPIVGLADVAIAPYYLKIQADGTNVKFFSSPDGVIYTQQFSETKATFFTTAPDQVGICIDSKTNASSMDIDYFRRTQ